MKEKEFNVDVEYGKLKDQFNLPNFKDLNSEFELSDISEGEFLLRSIRRRLCEKIDEFSNIIEGFIFPQSASLANFYEVKFLSDDEREKLSNLFKRLMVLNRRNLMFDLEPNEKEEAEFITATYGEWLTIKKELLGLVSIMEKSWTEEDKIPTDKGYFG